MKSKLFLILLSTSQCAAVLCGSVSSKPPRLKRESQGPLRKHQVEGCELCAQFHAQLCLVSHRWLWEKSHWLDESSYTIWQSRSTVVPIMISDTNLGLLWIEEKAPLKGCLSPLPLWSQTPSKPAQIRAMSVSVSFFHLLYAHLYKAPSVLLKATSDAGLLFIIPHPWLAWPHMITYLLCYDSPYSLFCFIP